MRLVMMNSEKRFAEREGHRLRGFETGHQSVWQSGAAGGGNGGEMFGRHARFGQGGGGDGNQVSQVFARGEFRDHAAVFRVQFICEETTEDSTRPS